MKRLSLANHRLMTGKSLHKRFETPVGIDVIDDDRSARSQRCPSAVHFKANVMFTMQTIMNEKVDLAKLGKQARKAPFARSPDIGPARLISAANRRANLSMPHMLQRRMVNAPQMTNSIPLKRF